MMKNKFKAGDIVIMFKYISGDITDLTEEIPIEKVNQPWRSIITNGTVLEILDVQMNDYDEDDELNFPYVLRNSETGDEYTETFSCLELKYVKRNWREVLE